MESATLRATASDVPPDLGGSMSRLRPRRVNQVTAYPAVPHAQSFGRIAATSPLMAEVFQVLRRLARTDVTLTLIGETGTGKDVTAHAVHEASARANAPFVVFDCGAVPPNLVESELFGHERGAFTGAHAEHEGAFERARGGTLFLDEIGELPLDLQPRLLRALDSRSIRRVGGGRDRATDVRIVAATNRDLEEALLRGDFREDLYYRLKVIEVMVPPLRERRGEIMHLTEFFIDRYARRYNRPSRVLSAELQQLFQQYDWPGNIRELENMVKRIVILQDEQLVIREMSRAPRSVPAYAGIGAGQQPHPDIAGVSHAAASADDEELAEADADDEAQPEVAVAMAPAGSRLADVAKAAAIKAERAIIEDTLRHVHWNRRRAAQQLGVSYKTLLNKIKECGISRK
jgi:two-component system response regulator AtoC